MQGVRLGRGTFVPRTAPPLPHHPPLVTFSLLRILEGILECFKKYHDIKVIFEILEYLLMKCQNISNKHQNIERNIR